MFCTLLKADKPPCLFLLAYYTCKFENLQYNVVLCPNQFNDNTLHGCTVPGTSNAQADTSDNQSGIFSRAITNNLIGNRVANAFNGMFFMAAGMGRGGVQGQVCESDAKLVRVEGNTWQYPGLKLRQVYRSEYNN